MGKRIKTQKRGRGGPPYRANTFRWTADVQYRMPDAQEQTSSVKGTIVEIIKCMGHTAPLIKVQYETKEVMYNFAPLGVRVGDAVEAGMSAQVKAGNVLPLKNIPEGTPIYNIECRPADRGKLVRASGCTARIVSITEKEVLVVLPSKKQRAFHPLCRATIGTIAGAGRLEKPLLKAGKKHHWMRAHGKLYPITSGVAMNAVDHPFGSGRGRHVGKAKTAPRFAPPGRNVGKIHARRTGRK